MAYEEIWRYMRFGGKKVSRRVASKGKGEFGRRFRPSEIILSGGNRLRTKKKCLT